MKHCLAVRVSEHVGCHNTTGRFSVPKQSCMESCKLASSVGLSSLLSLLPLYPLCLNSQPICLLPSCFFFFFFFSYSVCVNIVSTIRCDECQPIRASPIGSSTSVVSGITVILVFWSQIWPYLDDRAGYGILTGSDWGSKPSFIMSFTLNKHHAAMKKTLNQWLRLWPYKITICWGNKSSEKYINFS